MNRDRVKKPCHRNAVCFNKSKDSDMQTTANPSIKTMQQFTPLELETRPTVNTAAAAFHLQKAVQTMRIYACKENGPLRPIRVGAHLHWKTDDIRRLLGVAGHQKGFTTLIYLALIAGAALLAHAIMPGLFASLDLAGVAVLGAGVIGNSESLSQLYKHPDGHEINLARGFLTMTNDADESVSVPIGKLGLRELGQRLIALSDCEYTAAELAEQAGHALANKCLNAMLVSTSQAVSLRSLTNALQELQHRQHEAIAGFAVGMVNVIEVGLKNLPKGGE